MSERLSRATRHRRAALRRGLRNVWEGFRNWSDVFALYSALIVKRLPTPASLLYFGYSPGDDLLCTAVLRELRNRGRDKLLMVSNHADLFIGNKDPFYIRPVWKRYSPDQSTVAICQRFAKMVGAQFLRPHYAPLIKNEDRSQAPARHIIAELCASAGITGPVAIRPYLALSQEERDDSAWARNKVAIQSSGMGGRHPIRNKEWIEGRFQAVVDTLSAEVDFVQLGAPNDPSLRGARDLRGATTIRETAAILANARLFVGTVGFLMHVARAVECPAVIIFGGREAPWQSGYSCNLNLYTALPCAPCWRWNSCDFDRKCMTDIAAIDVVTAIRSMLAKPRGPLPIEVIEILPLAVK